jgi:hypothetical protein
MLRLFDCLHRQMLFCVVMHVNPSIATSAYCVVLRFFSVQSVGATRFVDVPDSGALFLLTARSICSFFRVASLRRRWEEARTSTTRATRGSSPA